MSLGAALEEVCDNVMVEPISGESIDRATAITDERAWLDIGFGETFQKSLL